MASIIRASRAFIRPGMIGGNRRELSAGSRGELAFRVKVRGNFFDRPKIRRMVDDMTYRSLYNAGYAVKQASKKGIGNAAPKQTKAGNKAVGSGAVVEFVGGLYRDLTMLSSGKPRPPGKPAKSWAPKRWLYYSVVDTMNRGMFGMPTVVIGTQRTPWLARLHEFGGTLQLTAYRIGVGAARNAYLRRSAGSSGAGRDSKGRFTKGVSLGPQKNQYEYGALIWANKRMKHSRNWDRTTITKSARYPARPFMQGAAGVQKAVAKANVKFRNMLRRAG
jgi:hypothetical protein